jgi:hypothetical protein
MLGQAGVKERVVTVARGLTPRHAPQHALACLLERIGARPAE